MKCGLNEGQNLFIAHAHKNDYRVNSWIVRAAFHLEHIKLDGSVVTAFHCDAAAAICSHINSNTDLFWSSWCFWICESCYTARWDTHRSFSPNITVAPSHLTYNFPSIIWTGCRKSLCSHRDGSNSHQLSPHSSEFVVLWNPMTHPPDENPDASLSPPCPANCSDRVGRKKKEKKLAVI